MMMMKGRAFRATATAAMLAVFGAPVMAEELFYVSGAVGNAVEDFKTIVKPWEEATGNTVTLVPMPSDFKLSIMSARFELSFESKIAVKQYQLHS